MTITVVVRKTEDDARLFEFFEDGRRKGAVVLDAGGPAVKLLADLARAAIKTYVVPGADVADVVEVHPL